VEESKEVNSGEGVVVLSSAKIMGTIPFDDMWIAGFEETGRWRLMLERENVEK
jgi:hypothetical protein